MIRTVFVTTDWEKIKDSDLDRPLHDAAFETAGIGLEHQAWWDPSVDWGAYDLVVIRSPWDYSTRVDGFLAWLDEVEGRARVENPPDVVRWNLNKHYLGELAELGVPVIPTDYVDGESDAVELLGRFGDREVVVKPVVSAGSRNTGRFRASDPAALRLARVILAEGQSVMIQPFAASVAEEGEVSLVFFNGEPSHAFRKGPILAPGGGLLGGTYKEKIARVDAADGIVEVARRADEAVRSVCARRFDRESPLLYARYDIVRQDDGSHALLEAELFEPAFFLHVGERAADRFAAAVAERVRALSAA